MKINNISQQIIKYINNNKHKKKLLIAVSSVAAVAVFFTAYALLIRPAISLETEPVISEEAHASVMSDQIVYDNSLNSLTVSDAGQIKCVISPAVGGGSKLVLTAGTGTVIPSDLFTNPDYGLSGYKDVITEVVIGSDITEIQANAFSPVDENGSHSPASQLRTVKFDEGSTLTTIGAGAFSGCSSLTAMNLENCTALTDLGAGAEKTEDGAFYNTGLKNITIPSGVTEIGNFTFYGCESLTNVDILENTNATMKMGAYVFAECTSLETVNLENLKSADLTFGTNDSINLDNNTATTEAANGMFYGCTSLKTLTLPNMSGSIAYLCKGCTSLTSIDLGNCTKLACNDTTGSANLKYFVDGCTNLQELDFSKMTGMTTLYKYIVQGGVKKVTLPPTLSHISDHVFQYTNVEEVVFTKDENGKSSLTTIDNSAFSDAKSLKELDLQFADSGNLSLDSYAFTGCISLEKLTISSPNGLNTFGHGCFKGGSSLQDLIWDVNSANVSNPTWETLVNKDTSDHIRFTVGPNVEKLPSALINQIQSKVSEYIFTPNHSFYIDGSADVPFKEKGCYYADANGNLYRLTANSDGTYEAELVYANRSGSGEFTVPETVTGTYYDNSGTNKGEMTFKVTKIGSDAFTDTAYTSITFTNPENITDVADSAFAGAYKLASVNGKTTEEDVKKTFTSCNNFGSNLFVETLIGYEPFSTVAIKSEDSVISVDDNKLLQVEVSTDSILFNEKGKLATGESAVVTLSVSNASSGVGPDKGLRVYVKVSDDDNCELTSEDKNIVFNKTEVEGIYYCDVPSDGGKNYTFTCTYPNNVAPNKKVYIWSVEADSADVLTEIVNKVIEPADTYKNADGNITATASTEYLEVTWDVEPEEYKVVKEAAGTPGIKKTDTATTVGDLSFKVSNQTTSRGKDIGSDYIDYVTYEDVLTLPNGFKWKDEILATTFETSIGADKKGGSITATIGGEVYTVCSLNLSSEILTAIGCTVVDNNLKITWTTENQIKTTQITPAETTVTYGNDVIIAENGVNSSITYEFTNKVSATPYSCYNGKGPQVEATAVQPLIAQEASLDFTKEWVQKPAFMGEKAVYRINVDNNTLSDYKATETSPLVFSDDLGTNQYIDAAIIQQMFTDPEYDGDNLTITINNAVLLPGFTSQKVTAVDGTTPYFTSVSNTATNPYHDGPADSNYSLGGTSATITISKDSATNSISVSTGTETCYVGEDQTYKTIQDVFDKIGYVVTQKDDYVLSWSFADKTFKAKTHEEYIINATVKNTFQALSEDFTHSIASTSQTYAYPVANKLIDEEGKTISSTDTVNTNYDLSILKCAYVDGVSKTSETLTEGLMDNEVIDYKLNIYHYGEGNYGLLPVVDHMSGIQTVLAPCDDNAGAAWATGLEIYTDENGTQYYVLNAEKEYKGVYLENAYADSITVKKTENGLDTLIKWYYVDEINDNYTIAPTYKAIVSQKYAGNENTILSYSLNNEAWANDLPTHRIYSTLGGKGTTITFKKNIVTDKGETPAEDTLWESNLPHPIQDTNVVTYRLDFENKSGAGITLDHTDFHDILPETDGFAWSNTGDNVNVRISYKMEEPGNTSDKHIEIKYNELDLLDLPDGSEFTITGTEPSYSIEWNEGFQMIYPEGVKGKAYIYVTLTFPDGDTWTEYVNKMGSDILYNTLEMHGVTSAVSHVLPKPGEAMLRKGVYETGYYVVDGSGNRKQYFRGSNRNNYVKTSDGAKVKNTVTYFVVLYNSSDSKLYLSSIYDLLPEGFEFLTLVSTPQIDAYDSPRSGVVGFSYGMPYNIGYTFGDQYFAKPQNGNLLKWWYGDNPNHMVSATTDSSGSRQLLQFDIVIDNNHKDELGYYLKPNEAVQFGYMCYTDDADISQADNCCVMEYLDYSLAGVNLPAESKQELSVSTYNKMSPENNGKAYIWQEDVLKAKGFDISAIKNPDNLIGVLKGDAYRKWLASPVTLTEGNIIPGITKSAGKYSVKKDESVDWTINTSNSGSNAMTDYTVEDTVQSPFVFTGNVGYTIYSNDESVESVYGQPKTDLVLEAKNGSNEYLFRIESMNDTGISVVSNKGVLHTLSYAVSTEIPVTLTTANNATVNTNITLCFTKTDNSVTMKIGFTDRSCSIPADGYSVLTLQTSVPATASDTFDDGVYVNEAALTPAQSWDKSKVTQGTVEGSSITSQAFVSIYSSYPTTSYKEISAEGKNGISSNFYADNTVTEENRDKDYILVDNKNSKITYTLNFSCAEKDMDEIIFIDNLPEVGDVTPINDNMKRNSEFKLNFAEDPYVIVKFVEKTDADATVETVLTESTKNEDGTDTVNYIVEYSTSNSGFGKTTDWTGTEGGQVWEPFDVSKVNEYRSIRIRIFKDLPKGHMAQISFNAVIDQTVAADPGEYAWNSFAYNFKADGTDIWLYNAPSYVGVGIPGVPVIEKTLVNDFDVPVTADEDRSFGFIIYEGDGVSFDNGYDAASIATALNDSGKNFTCVFADVKQNASSSGQIYLTTVKKWSVLPGGDGIVETGDTWSWTDGQTYTIVEIDENDPRDKYSFGYINDFLNKERIYTFTYDRTKNNVITVANVKIEETYEMPKTGGIGTRLFTVSGLLLAAGGGYGLWRKRKRRTQ